MINKALNFLENQLNLVLSQPGNPQNVLLTPVVNERGEVNIQAGQLSLMLVNIEEEKILKAQLQRERRTGDQVQFSNPEIKLNLLVMLAANPGNANYLDALGRLSLAMMFFQGTSVFNKIDFSFLAPDIERLSVELFSLTLEQQNQLWASLGAKYLPSALYKVRLVIIDQALFGDQQTVIKSIDNSLKKIG